MEKTYLTDELRRQQPCSTDVLVILIVRVERRVLTNLHNAPVFQLQSKSTLECGSVVRIAHQGPSILRPRASSGVAKYPIRLILVMRTRIGLAAAECRDISLKERKERYDTLVLKKVG